MKKAADSGITPRKIIVVACIVKSWLNISGVTRFCSGLINCVRIIMASIPPEKNMMKAVTP